MIHEGAIRGYPRPQFRRESWTPLDGAWQFAIDRDDIWQSPSEVPFTQTIEVPFSPETTRSGIGDSGLYKACWYRRSFVAPPLASGERLIVHFGAVDYAAVVWVNGNRVGRHVGGYTPFEMDVTDVLDDSREQNIVVRAFDDPQDLGKPRGKQDWQENPHAIWYERTSGIWQSVWLEVVPPCRLTRLRWTSNLERWEIGLDVEIAGERREDLQLQVRLAHGEQLVAEDAYRIVSNEVVRRIALPDPGIDDYRNDLLWSPWHPTLIEAELELSTMSGEVIDRVWSYTAIRSVGTEGDRFMLNGRPYRLRLILDQGYWDDSGMTPPDDEAVRHDVELVRQMGFNGVRKHQKVEDPRYLYWADVLGVLVWEEMPSAYRFTKRSVERLTREWIEVLDRDLSHPCIVAWVPFNESWGVPDLTAVQPQRSYVSAIYHLTKTLDASRPVIGNDGWESIATDIIGIHDYDNNPKRLAQRYATHEAIPDLLARERPSGRLLLLQGQAHGGQPLMLTEFGGIAFSQDADAWGYTRVHGSDELSERYQELMSAVHSTPVLTGFCYTQFADTFQEANGLLYSDRTPKFPLHEMGIYTRGPRRAHEATPQF